MAIVFVEFEPLSAYQTVQAVFRLFTDAHGDTSMLRRYDEERDALNLALEDDQGCQSATNWIHISDFGDLGKEIEVQTADPTFWKNWRESQ